MNDFSKLEKEARESDGYIAQRRLIYFKNVYQIYNRNFHRLNQLLQAFSDPEKMLPVWDIERRDDLDNLLIELLTYLHNYLASFKTLVDHTRIIINRDYIDHSFYKDYQARVDSDFTDNPLASFIQDLRNYLLHYSLPSTFSEFNISKDPNSGKEIVQTRATIKKDHMIHWSGWSVKARVYLENAEDDIELLNIIKEHEDKVRNFNEWIMKSLNDIHNDDFEVLNMKIEELRRI